MKGIRFKDKVVLVTGGASGIGRTTALAFAEEGANVVIAARREHLGEEAVQEMAALGSDALYVKTDVRNPETIDRLFTAIEDRYGRLDIAFNNARTMSRSCGYDDGKKNIRRVSGGKREYSCVSAAPASGQAGGNRRRRVDALLRCGLFYHG